MTTLQSVRLLTLVCLVFLSSWSFGATANGSSHVDTVNIFKLLKTPNFALQFYETFNSDSLASLSSNGAHSELSEGESRDSILALDTSGTECLAQLRAVINGIHRREWWSIKFIDSWGKIPSGILYGHLLEMGNFDECVSIYHFHTSRSADSVIKGKYCLAHLPVTDGESSQKLSLKIGICLPAVCQAGQIDTLLKEMLAKFLNSTEGLDTTLLEEGSCSAVEEKDFEIIDWMAIGILILILALLVVSTLYDYSATYYRKSPNTFLISFSLRTNVRELFSIKSQRNAPHIIPCLHGIRCLSIVWIVFGHCYLMLVLLPNINAITIQTWARTPFSMFLQMGTVSVDTFFFLSGLLLVLVSLRQMDRAQGRINIPLMYLHRYLRLTPVLALAVLLFMSLYRYMGNGPLWRSFTRSSELCAETWWATLLYVQNYAAAGKMCLGHSWYLAVDTQLCLVSPLVLIAIWRWKRKGLAALLVIGLLLFACLFYITVINDYVVFKKEGNLGADNAEMRNIYYSTHARASPWIIGITFGYFLHRRAGRPNTLSKISILLGWVFSLSLICAVLFSLYQKTQPEAEPITPLEGAFFLSLSRVAWPLALCWVVFACVNGNAGPVDQLLSWSIWQPMSKLSYCMYIWHLVVETINAGRTKTNTYFSNYDAILRFWGDFGITLLVSLVMYLGIESPVANLEKLIFSRRNATPNSNVSAAAATISQENLCNK